MLVELMFLRAGESERDQCELCGQLLDGLGTRMEHAGFVPESVDDLYRAQPVRGVTEEGEGGQ